MIHITIYRNGRDYRGYSISGHAEFAEYGTDIVCAAVSVLAQNTANSIEKFTEDAFTGEAAEEGGSFEIRFPEGVSNESRLLIDSMILGFESIQESYGKQYITIRYKEV